MKRVELVGIVLWCNTHKCRLENCGSNRFLYPTDSEYPIPNKEGFFEIDTSEFYCPVDKECDQEWSVYGFTNDAN